MSRLKKIFVIISACISVFTATFVITICKVKSNVGIAVGIPYSAVVFNCTTAGTEIKDEQKLKNLETEIFKLTNLSVYNKLINSVSIENRIYMDSDGKFAKYSTDLLTSNLVVEFVYNVMQDLVVFDGDDTRVVSYYCLSFVIPNTKGFTEIAVYYSLTSNTDGNEKNESYASNTPLILYGNAENLLKFAKELNSEN